MKINRYAMVYGALYVLAGTPLHGENLMADASFEAPVKSLFTPQEVGASYVAKVKAADAPEGQQVLEIRAWDDTGTAVCSPAMAVTDGSYRWTLDLRRMQAAGAESLSLRIVPTKGGEAVSETLLTLGNAGEWKTFTGTAELSNGEVRLELVIRGAPGDQVLQMDRVGFLPQDDQSGVVDNALWEKVDATSAANGGAWRKEAHFERWYQGIPSGYTMLAGNAALPKGVPNEPVRLHFTAKEPGRHKLWLHYLASGKQVGEIGITVSQSGQTVRELEFNTARDEKARYHYRWLWHPVELELEAGEVEVALSRPSTGASRLARNIDCLILTNLLSYQPGDEDLRSRIYVRWTNTGEGEGYGLWTFVHRNLAPWFAYGGVLSKAGFSKRQTLTPQRDKWVAPGESTPWADLSPYLRPEGRFNRVQFIATRGSNAARVVQGAIRGKLEFAVESPENVVREVAVDQSAPRILVTVPGDFAPPDAAIRTPKEILAGLQSVTPPKAPEPPVRHLDLSIAMDLRWGLDHEELIDAEYAQLRQIGFNGITFLRDGAQKFGDGEQARKWLGERGVQRFGLWAGTLYDLHGKDQTQPDAATMAKRYASLAKDYDGMLEMAARVCLADEPAGPDYKALVQSPQAVAGFRHYLSEKRVKPEDLGASSLDEVMPVAFEKRMEQPQLFYYSGMYRLKVLAELTKEAVRIKREHLPGHVKAFVNYSPQLSWVHWGADPFLLQREGGLEMAWTEDWLGYYVSPQFISDTYAVMRSAGDGQPIGGYMVASSGPASLQRLKYYATVAGGARELAFYKYGPAYISIDSWSEEADKYPILAEVNREMARLDEALDGTHRRKSDIAIVYNRTAAIWAGEDATAELDARFIRWALSHEGFDADIVPEEDIEAGKLGRYKALYLPGVQLRRESAAAIAQWVKEGGVLVGTAGAGSRDEFDQPMEVLEPVFGIKSEALEIRQPAGRPKHELQSRRSLSTIAIAGATLPAARFSRLCYDERLTALPGAMVAGADKEGRPAVVVNRQGRGAALRMSFLPGLAYVQKALNAGSAQSDYLLTGYDPGQRRFLAWGARRAGCAEIGTTNLAAGEVVRYDGKGRSVLFVMNYEGNPSQDFVLTVPDAAWAHRAMTGRGEALKLTPLGNGNLRIAGAIREADAIILEE